MSIVLLAIPATMVFYIFRLVLRGRLLAVHIASLFMAYELYGYSYAFPRLRRIGEHFVQHSATPFTRAVIILLFLAIVFGLMAFGIDWLTRRFQALRKVPLLKVGLFVVCFIFAVQIGKVSLRLWTIRHDLTYSQPMVQLSKSSSSKPGPKPNVYYLLFDRYASATTLKNIYGYDNSNFENFLTGQGFSNRDNAFANYPFTTQSVSSTLSMGYHTELGAQFRNDSKNFQTAFPYRAIINDSPVAQIFKSNGYQYNEVSSWWDFTRNMPSADTEPSQSFRLRALGKNFWQTDLQRDIINKSILSPLLLKGLTLDHTTIVQYQLDRNPAENFVTQMAALKNIAAHSTTQTTPQYTFAHILSPHDPYVFDADGNQPDYDGNRTDNDIDETVKYNNQLTYINTQFESLIATIRRDDPKAVVFIQADEGPYPKQFRGQLTPTHYYDPINLPLDQMRQKFGIMASYYMPGVDNQTVQSNINSSVNVFRFIFDRYLGYQLPMLPDCNFTAGDKYTMYTYKLVTGQLKGTTNPAVCQQYQ